MPSRETKEGVISAIFVAEGVALIALEGIDQSERVAVPPELRERTRPGARVVAFVEEGEIVDWTVVG